MLPTKAVTNCTYLWRTTNAPHNMNANVTRTHPTITKLHTNEIFEDFLDKQANERVKISRFYHVHVYTNLLP